MNVFQNNYTVALYDVDCFDRLKASSFLNYMQDAASKHANILGVGHNDLTAKDRSWFMAKAIIDIRKYPKFQDKIKIETWPKAVEKLLTFRDFIIYDEKDEVTASATTMWVMINVKTKKIERLDAYRDGINALSEKQGVEERPGKISTEGATFSISNDSKALFSAIDYNKHLNNARYFDLIYDLFSQEHHKNNLITRAHINFLHEVKCGDEITIKAEDIIYGKPQIIEAHQSSGKDKTTVFQATVTWKKI